MNKDIKILAIETSCDETAASVITVAPTKVRIGRKYEITNSPIVLSNVVSSQIDLHAKTGGVVPEVASRAHMENIIPVIQEALDKANLKFKIQNLKSNLNSKLKIENSLKEITHIAVTAGPGLIGSLLVGFNTAKAMAYALDLPIVPVNHIEGHIYSALAQNKAQNSKLKTQNCGVGSNKASQANEANEADIQFPILALTVSGGHTSLTLMRDHGKYETIGQTRDDAAGEAFDKVAKLLDLGYPGGPIVSRLAEEYRKKKPPLDFARGKKSKNPNKANLANQANEAIVLPRPMIKDKNFDFSFSGLKTAVLDVARETEHQNVIARSRATKQSIKEIATTDDGLAMTEKGKLSNDQKSEICTAFEDAAVDVLVIKTLRAAERYKPKAVILAGGVAANRHLREELALRLSQNSKSQTLNSKQIQNSKSKIQNSNETIEQSNNVNFWAAPKNLCGDNAAMIGLAAYYHIVRGDTKKWNQIKVDSNLKI